jgi:beta-glucosidase
VHVSAVLSRIVQAYAAGPAADAGRPVRVLGAFAVVTAAGEQVEAVLTVPARVLAVWDQAAGGWARPRGTFTIELGRSSRDLRLRATATVGG